MIRAQSDQPLWMPKGSVRALLAMTGMVYACYIGSLEVIGLVLAGYGILGENSPLRGKP